MGWLFLLKLDKAIAFWLSVIVFNHSTILDATKVLKRFFQKIAIDIKRKIVNANSVTWGSTSLSFATLLVSGFYNELIRVAATSFRWRWPVSERSSFPLLIWLFLSHHWWVNVFSVSASTSRFHSNTIFDFCKVLISIFAWVVLGFSGISLFMMESFLLKVVLITSIAIIWLIVVVTVDIGERMKLCVLSD